MSKEDLIKALEEIKENYRLVSLTNGDFIKRDCYDEDKTLGMVYLNNKHSIQDFQNAIYKARDKHSNEIYKYGNDWEYISQDLGDFDYIEVDCYEKRDYVVY